MLSQLMSCPASIHADRPNHNHRFAINCSRVGRDLDWYPKVSFEEGLRGTVKWYLDHEGCWRDILDKRYDGWRLGTGNR